MSTFEQFKNFRLDDSVQFQRSPVQIPGPVRKLLRDIWRLNRVSNSDDMQTAQERVLAYCEEHLRGTGRMHFFTPGTVYNHWIVPRRWNVKDYWIKDAAGRLVDNLDDHPLALCPYSHSTHEVMSLEELTQQVVVHPNQPESLSYFGHRMYRHWVDGWNVSLSRRKLEALTPGDYEVFIDTEFTDDPMSVFEYVLNGRQRKSIVLVAHICHPGQVNDSLSGCIALIQVLQKLEAAVSETNYTYRILLVPEVIGSVAFLAENLDQIDDMAFVLCANMTSHDAPLVMDKSKSACSFLDLAVELATRSSGEDHIIARFGEYPDCGDEICFDSFGINIPSVTLSRDGQRFDAYHSSADTLSNFIRPENQKRHQKLVDVIFDALMIMENNFAITPKYRGLPCLSNPEINLYLSPSNINNSLFEGGMLKNNFGQSVDARYFMEFFLDALNHPGVSPLEIAYAADLPFWPVYRYAAAFAENGLVTRQSVDRADAFLDVSKLPLLSRLAP